MKATNDHAFTFVSCKKHIFKTEIKLKNIRMHTNGLCYITHGSGMIIVNGVKHAIKQGTSILLDSNLSIEVSLTITSEVHFYLLQYMGISIFKLDHTTDYKMIRFQITSEARFISLLEEIGKVTYNDVYISWLKKQALLYELLYVAFKEKDKNKDYPIKRAIDYMNKHYIENLNIGDLSRSVFMTQSSFCRAFKRETGYTPSEYLRNLRIEQAKNMLKTSMHSIKDVARTVGFADELYFSRLFKVSEGMPPTIYRKKYEPRIAIIGNLFLQDHLLALGIKPVAAPSFPTECPTETGFPIYLEDQLQGTKRLNAEMPFDLQDVLKMAPNYLLKQNNRDHFNDTLHIHKDTKIIHVDKFLNWQDYQRDIAKVVGREELAETVIQNIRKVEQIAKEKLKNITRTGRWTIIRVLENSILVHGVTGHPISDLLYDGLGFQCDNRLKYSCCRNYSLDEMFELNPERMIILWSDRKLLEHLFENPLWSQLQAVQHKHLYIPNSSAWDPWGPSGRSYIVKECVQYFLKYYS